MEKVKNSTSGLRNSMPVLMFYVKMQDNKNLVNEKSKCVYIFSIEYLGK